MKKFLFCLSLFLGLSSAHARGIIINPHVIYSPYNAQAELCNYTGRAVVCNMKLNGQTTNGEMLYAFLGNTPIFPGSCVYAYINNYSNWPIINAWATSWCTFLNY